MSLIKKLRVLGFEQEIDYEALSTRGVVEITRWMSQAQQPTQAQIDAVSDQDADDAEEDAQVNNAFNVSKKDKAIVLWVAQIAGKTPAEARAELKAIWQSLP